MLEQIHKIAIAIAFVFLTAWLLAGSLESFPSSPSSYTNDETNPGSDQETAKLRIDKSIANYTWMLAVFTGILAASTIGLWIVTGHNARAARDAVEAMSEDFISTHRPRIRIRHVWLNNPIDEGQDVTIGLTIANVGSTPAAITIGAFATLILDASDELPPEPPLLDKLFGVTSPILDSGYSFRFDIIADNPKPRKLTKADAADLRNGAKLLYCFGTFDYRDTSPSNRVKKTAYCRVLKNPTSPRLAVHPNPDYEYQD